MGPLFQAAGLNLDVDVPPHLPLTLASPEAMRIVLRNLLDDAIQYTQPGGNVGLQASSLSGTIRIVVSDNGQGIPPEDLPHIFERVLQGRQGEVSKAERIRLGPLIGADHY